MILSKTLIKYILIFYTFYLPLFSQSNSPRFRNISIDDGLSDFFVYSLLEDKNGLLWIGTQEGVNRYDGNEFITFNKDVSNKNSISNNFVFCLEEDSKGIIWMGTSNGLNSYNPKKKEFRQWLYDTSNPNTISNNWVETLLYDSVENYLWIGTYGGLNRLNLDNNEIKRIWPEQAGNEMKYTVLSLCIIDDNIYIGTKGAGLYSYNRVQDKVVKIVTSQDFDIRALISYNKKLFIGTFYNGLYEYNTINGRLRKKEITSKQENKLSQSIRSLLIDEDNLYIGTDGFGLYIHSLITKNTQLFQQDMSEKHGLSNNHINHIKSLGSGLIVFATRDGFYFLDKYEKPFIRINKNSDPYKLANYNIRTIIQDNNNNLWLGTHYNGAYKINLSDNKKKQFVKDFNNPNSLSSNFVRVMFLDSKNQVWLGTYKGLNKYIPQKNIFKQFYHSAEEVNSLSNDFISSIDEDNKQNLWIGTEYGYSVLNIETDQISSFKLGEQRLAENDIRYVLIDSNEEIWFGTWDGLHRYNPKTNENRVYRNDSNNLNSLRSNTIFAINEDINGNIWIGLAGGGLNIYNKETDTFINYNKSNGLSGNTIHSVLFDKDNNAWLSTYKDGLNKLILSKSSKVEEIKVYRNTDGLHDNSFNPLSFYKTKNDYLYFGGPKGFSSFYPDSIKDYNISNSIYLTQFKLFNQDVKIKNTINNKSNEFLSDSSIQYQSKLQLSYDKNFFSIDFSAIEYRSPEKINYAYKLDGFETNWTFSGNRAYANYTDIKSGTYKFLVRSTNKDGTWLNNQRELIILISPPFWERWWFYFIIILAIFMILYSIHIYRLKQIKKVEKIKSKISHGLHDEIASNLSSIIIFSSFIDTSKKDKSENIALTEKISSLARESVESVKDLMWMIDDTKETLGELVNRFERQLKENCKLNNIDLNFNQNISIEYLTKSLPLELRDNLWFLLKEAFTNIIKHAKATSIICHIEMKDEQLMIKLKDNGIGFDINQKTEGRGLHIMKKRAEQLKAELKINSKLNVGTKITLKIDL
jgi:ligand-binding sensor domain-containing protein/two-component sensor histidine kinase